MLGRLREYMCFSLWQEQSSGYWWLECVVRQGGVLIITGCIPRSENDELVRSCARCPQLAGRWTTCRFSEVSSPNLSWRHPPCPDASGERARTHVNGLADPLCLSPLAPGSCDPSERDLNLLM